MKDTGAEPGVHFDVLAGVYNGCTDSEGRPHRRPRGIAKA